jgi:hypothetical protein
MNGHGYRRLTADELVTQRSVILWGLVLLASSDGGDVTVYNGTSTASGDEIGKFEGLGSTSTVIDLGGLRCERGLYVDIGSNMTEVLVIYDPIELGTPTP